MTAASPQLTWKQGFLYALIASVACSALLGIAAVLMGDFGDLEIRILLTTLTIAAASVCGLSCGAALEAGRGNVLPTAGIPLSLLSAMMLIAGIWGEFNDVEYWKSAVSLGILAVCCSHVSLLLMARLSPRFEWSIWAAHIAIFSVGTVIIAMLWAEGDGDFAFRILGVAAILDAAITIVIPVFHRLSRGDLYGVDSNAVGNSNGSRIKVAEIDREIQQLEMRIAELQQLKTRLDRPHQTTSQAL